MVGCSRHLAPGDRIVIREVLHDKVWTVRPLTVIENTDDHLVSYLTPGSYRQPPRGRARREVLFDVAQGEWELDKKEFLPPGMLRIAPCCPAFEVFASVAEEGGVGSWYVNFQEPLRRGPHGCDTMDETLDLIVAADFSSWHRREEDELEMAVAMGVYDQIDAQRLGDTCAGIEESLGSDVVPRD